MGEKSQLQKEVERRQQPFNPFNLERRFLIVDWASDTNLRTHRRHCAENTLQYVSSCPICHMPLNAPIQTCLGLTSPPTKKRRFRYYKRFIQSFSSQYQVIRSLLLEIEFIPQF